MKKKLTFAFDEQRVMWRNPNNPAERFTDLNFRFTEPRGAIKPLPILCWASAILILNF